MNTAWANPYEAIENAQEHFGCLIQALTESRAAVDEDIREPSSSPRTRCLDALNLIRENLVTLGDHLERSRHILNDLRTLSRLLYRERSGRVQRREPQFTQAAVYSPTADVPGESFGA